MHAYDSAFDSFLILYGAWLWEASWQAGLLALAVVLFARLYPRVSPAWAYALLLVALAKFAMPLGLALPVSLFELVRTTSVTTATFEYTSDRPPTPDLAAKNTSSLTAVARPDGGIQVEHSNWAQQDLKKSDITAESTINSGARDNEFAVRQQLDAQTQLATGYVPLGASKLTAVILLVSGGFYLLWLLFQFLRVTKTRRDSVPIQEHSLKISDSTRNYLAGIKIAKHKQLAAPVAIGILWPTIVLPEKALAIPVRHLEGVLLHEAAHIRRRDLITILVEHLLLSVWWFHPMFHLMRRELSCLRERCCDDIAIEKGKFRTQDYCQALLDVAKSVRASRPTLGCGIGAGQSLGKRIQGLMQPRYLPAKGLGRRGGCVLILFAAFVLPGGAIVPAENAPQTQAQAESPQSSPSEPDSNQPQRPAIEGFIRNANDEPDGTATVIAYIHRNEWDKTLLKTQTDSRGYFCFNDCPQGSVTLTAYNDQEQVGGRFCGYLEEQKTLEEQRIKLFHTAVATLSIRNDDGELVSGAELRSIRWRVADSDWFWALPDVRRQVEGSILSQPQSSDAAGIMVIPGVPRHAECIVQVQHADYAPTESTSFKASLATIDMTIKRGDPIHIDVVDATTEQPVTDAYVRVSGSPSSIYRMEKVDEKGKITIRLADASRITLQCYHPDLVCPSWLSIDQWGMSSSQQSKSLSGALRSNRLSSTSTTHTFKLYPKGKVRGTVVDEQSAAPLEGVYVSLVADNRQQFSSTRTDQNGNYELTGPADFVTLQIRSGNGFWAVANQSITVKIEAGDVVEARSLEAKRLPALKGQVIDELGNPVENAIVFIAGIADSKEPTLTDSTGKFELEIDREDLYLTAEAASLETPQRGAGSIPIAELVAGKPLEIRLAPEGTISGKLVDESGSLLQHVQVHLIRSLPKQGGFSRSRSHTTTTDQEGNFTFNGLESTSRYRLSTYDSAWRDLYLSDWYSGSGKHDLAIVQATAEQAAFLKPTIPGEAPELDCPNWLNSEALELANLRGNVVLLDFWGTWCGPCVAELPMINRAYELYASKGLVVIGVHNNIGTTDRIREFLQERPWLTYPIAIDNQEGTTCSRYDVRSFPTAVLIGRDGKILQVDGLRGAQLLLRVREAILYD